MERTLGENEANWSKWSFFPRDASNVACELLYEISGNARCIYEVNKFEYTSSM